MARQLDPDFAGPFSFALIKRAVVPEPRAVAAAVADTPLITDEHQQIVYSAAGLVTVTAPTAAVSPNIKPGYATKLVALGAAGLTVAVGVGDTLRAASGVLVLQYKSATLTLLSEAAGARVWLLDGGNTA